MTLLDVSVFVGAWENTSVRDLLVELELEHLLSIFEQEHISMDVLMDMSHDDLSSIGVTAFGHRHRILRKVKELAHSGGAQPAVPVGVATASHVGTQLIELPHSDKDYIAVSEEVRIRRRLGWWVRWRARSTLLSFCCRCRAQSATTEMMGGLAESLRHTRSSK